MKFQVLKTQLRSLSPMITLSPRVYLLKLPVYPCFLEGVDVFAGIDDESICRLVTKEIGLSQ